MTLAAHTKKDIILDALHRNGMAPDVRTLVIWTKGIDHGMNVKTMTKALWALQKQQLVGFAERRGELFKIRMTDVAAAALYGREKRERAPVERVVEARKPKIIPTPEYKVPEPPRYAAPSPPAQNIKSFTDEQSAVEVRGSTSEVHPATAEVMGRNVVVDTHTQYQPDVKHNLYPDRPKSRAGMISQRVAARFIDGLDQIGGRGSRRDAARAVGIGTNSRPTTIGQAAEHWGWIERDGKEIVLTDAGREILRQYRGSAPAPMPVVARDVADAQPKSDDVFEGIHEAVARINHATKEERAEFKREEVKAAGRIMAGVPNLDDYPLIKDLMGKESRLARYERAAEILAEDPDDQNTGDLVLALLEKIQITDLEREVIRFVNQVSGAVQTGR